MHPVCCYVLSPRVLVLPHLCGCEVMDDCEQTLKQVLLTLANLQAGQESTFQINVRLAAAQTVILQPAETDTVSLS